MSRAGRLSAKPPQLLTGPIPHNYRKLANLNKSAGLGGLSRVFLRLELLRHNGLTPLSLLKSSMFEMCVQSEANQKRLDLEQEYSDR